MHILIIGGMGKTAEPIIELLLEQNYEISVFDIATHSDYVFAGKVRVLNGNVCDYESIFDAMKDTDIVIHLAVNIHETKDDHLSFDTNVFGMYNVLRSAQVNNIKKTIIASSAPVHVLEELEKAKHQNSSINYFCHAGEDFTYDLTKNIQELIAENFALTYNMHISMLRLGHIVDGKNDTDLHNSPLNTCMYCRGGWVCKYDVARAFSKAIESNISGYQMFNIIGSYQAAEYFDMQHTEKVLGFECTEKFYNIQLCTSPTNSNLLADC